MRTPDTPPSRTFIWFPLEVHKPSKSKLELDATDPENAKLYYEETVENTTPAVLEQTRSAWKMLAQAAGMPEEFKQRGNVFSFRASGEAAKLSAMMASEFLIQSLKGNPEKQFWRFVDGLQMFLSTNNLPLRKLYAEYFGESLMDEPQGVAWGGGKMVRAECDACHMKLEVPAGFVANAPSMTCPNADCKHVGKPAWKDKRKREAHF